MNDYSLVLEKKTRRKGGKKKVRLFSHHPRSDETNTQRKHAGQMKGVSPLFPQCS